jgi:hypothetical protein
MKTLVSKLGLLAAAGLMASTFVTTAAAQTSNLMRVHIPFAFLAGNQTLPAGDYMMKIDSGFNLLDILPMQGTRTHRVLLQSQFVRRPKGANNGGLLTFAKYGERLVLRGIWTGGDREGRVLKTSKAEIELARGTGGTPAAAESSVMIR